MQNVLLVIGLMPSFVFCDDATVALKDRFADTTTGILHFHNLHKHFGMGVCDFVILFFVAR